MRPRVRTWAMVMASVMVGALWTACESVPDIRFVDPDAADSTPDAAKPDVGVPPSSSSDGAVEASATPSCPLPEPSGALCCGNVWCVGACEASNCSACAQAGCAEGELCCGKPQGVLCKERCP